MDIFDRLSNNKGATSGAQSKALAQSILNGRTDILLECIDLLSCEIAEPAQKDIRSGVSRVVEVVALNRPDLVAPYLQRLMPVLAAQETQTRGMIIRTMGFCAHLNKPVAQNAMACAEKYIEHKEGSSLACATDLFLGDLGAISEEDAQYVFPLLERSMENLITNEQDWLLEALFRVFQQLGKPQQEICFEFAERWQDSARKSTRQKAKRILRLRR
ncbi:MAG: hypothetical protein EHM40_22370 [Chloroflexi bacterium]|nr:MAG: hypothetical protein EHM40_22370 [Chloroflexota bacterium]